MVLQPVLLLVLALRLVLLPAQLRGLRAPEPVARRAPLAAAAAAAP